MNSGITYTTQSDALVVSTGLADQNSFSLSFSNCTPTAAWEKDNVQVTVQVLAADHFNNLVPDGTAISFTTEGGAIDGSCLTGGGGCTVAWRSQLPRPSNGRFTVLATAIGNESFLDANSNGGYDDNDPLFDALPAPGNEDLPEAWRDDNENGLYDSGSEEFVDFNQDGVYTGADGAYTGVLCSHTSDCATATSLHVRRQGHLVMATEESWIEVFEYIGDTRVASISGLPADTSPAKRYILRVWGIQTRDEYIAAGYPEYPTGPYPGQYPASGASVSVATDNGTLSGISSWVVPDNCNTLDGQPYETTFAMHADDTSDFGTLTISVQIGNTTTYLEMNVND